MVEAQIEKRSGFISKMCLDKLARYILMEDRASHSRVVVLNLLDCMLDVGRKRCGVPVLNDVAGYILRKARSSGCSTIKRSDRPFFYGQFQQNVAISPITICHCHTGGGKQAFRVQGFSLPSRQPMLH